MMYDGALKFMEAGRHAMAQGDLAKQNTSLQRAQRIVFELMACIDREKGGEMANSLMAFYTYVLEELVQANCNDESERIDRCIRVFSELRDGWSQIAGPSTSKKDDSAAAA